MSTALDTLIGAAATLCGLGAAAAWALAVWSGLSAVRATPSGGRFASLMDLGWWRFASIERRAGSAAALLSRNRKAFFAFFAFVFAGTAVAVLAAMQSAPSN